MREEIRARREPARRATSSRRALSFSRTTSTARAHGDDSFIERIDDGVEQRVLRLERREARRELLGHSVQRDGEIADFAWCGERGPAIELAGGDRLRDVAQLGDRPRYASRERECENQRADERDQARDENVALRAAHDLAELRRADRDARVAERMSNGDVDLVVAGRRARPHRPADARCRLPRRPPDARSGSRR